MSADNILGQMSPAIITNFGREAVVWALRMGVRPATGSKNSYIEMLTSFPNQERL